MTTLPLDTRRLPIRIDAVTLDATRFPNEHGRQPQAWVGTPLELIGTRHLIRRQKAGTTVFSAATYPPGKQRGKRYVTEATALVYDFDHLSSSDQARVLRLLEGRAYVAYTSFSHGADGPDDCCFRVVLLINRPIRPDEFEHVWEAGFAALGQLADTKARDLSRIWYVASCPPERADLAWIRVNDGVLMDIDAVLSWQRERLRAEVTRPVQATLALPQAPLGEGERNSALTSLAGALRRRGMSDAGIQAALSAENAARCVPPLPDEEVSQIVRSVCTYDPESPLVLANRTDYGNGERLAWFARDDLRYVAAQDRWLVWDGRRWRPDGKERVFTRAAAMVRALAAQAETVEDPDEREALRRHAMRSESVSRLSSMLRVAGNLLSVAPEILDRPPLLLNCQNGTVDLQTGALRPHDRADLLTRIVPVTYDPEATCPLWTGFLDRIFSGRAAVIDFIQRAVGYSLTGLNTEQVLFLAVGSGANGKSTFLEVLRILLNDYATNAEFGTFLKRDGDGARNDLARLAGARLVTASEAERAPARARQAPRREPRQAAHRRRRRHRPLPVQGVLRVPAHLQGLARRQPPARHLRQRRRHLAASVARALQRRHPRDRARQGAEPEAARRAPRHPRLGHPGLSAVAGRGSGRAARRARGHRRVSRPDGSAARLPGRDLRAGAHLHRARQRPLRRLPQVA